MEHRAKGTIADFEFRIANLGKSKEFNGEGIKIEFLSNCGSFAASPSRRFTASLRTACCPLKPLSFLLKSCTG